MCAPSAARKNTYSLNCMWELYVWMHLECTIYFYSAPVGAVAMHFVWAQCCSARASYAVDNNGSGPCPWFARKVKSQVHSTLLSVARTTGVHFAQVRYYARKPPVPALLLLLYIISAHDTGVCTSSVHCKCTVNWWVHLQCTLHVQSEPVRELTLYNVYAQCTGECTYRLHCRCPDHCSVHVKCTCSRANV